MALGRNTDILIMLTPMGKWHFSGYNQFVDHVGIYGQRRLTEALNKDSLVQQKEYPMESSSKSRESGITSSSTMWESMDRGNLRRT
ncbi:hypothetical protein Taro_021926 [Colocasia esculenta]|uniref:Uncharacterized protein n=1 Tax=Colocasia esculenta TaxID=4460 RepID=A0A843V9R2_COLES|nr:hypothetical protein [Colocasia esculenta]